jgi:ankyrin repeat protein
MLAVYNGSREAAHLLIVRGANVNGLDKVGNTPLMGACFKGYVELVELLLECGANVSLKNQSGADALQLAQMFDQHAIVEVLQRAAAK